MFDAENDRWPILIRPDEVINLKEAAHRISKAEKTVRGICKKYRIARQISAGSPLEISAPALLMICHGDIAALELLRQERRDHPRVRRYFDFLGLPA